VIVGGVCRLVFAAAAVCTAACGPRPASSLPPTHLVAGVAQPRLGASADGSTSRVAALLERSSLLRLDRACRPEPALAERVIVDQTGRTCSLTLHRGLTFHDGTPIDAAAIAALVTSALDRRGRIGPPPGLLDVGRVDAVDALTVRILLSQPSPLLPEALAGLEVRGGRDGDSAAGPYQRASEGPGAIEMVAFAGHYLGRPAIDRIVLRSFESPRTAWAALLRGEVGLLYEVSPDSVAFVEPSRAVQVRSFLRPFVYLVGFNTHHPVLRRQAVRHALSIAVDRERLIRRVLDGRARPAFDPVWPLHWALDGDAPVRGFDRDAARRSIDREGLVIRPTRERADGPPSRFAFTCLVPAGIPLLEALAVAVQRDLFDVGVDMQLEALPLEALGLRLASGDFDAYLLDMNGFGLSWTYRLWHSATAKPFIDSGYAGADAALDRIRHASGEHALRQAVNETRRVFREEAPGLFLCWVETSRAVSRQFALPPGRERDVLLSLPRWQLAPASR
jgi:peptide/nickel transport system substrate-binding protein